MKDLLVINVLPKEYHGKCHIKGSINVPLQELETYAKDLQKDTPIVVYCAHYECAASRNAFELLQKLGFTNVWAYEGGIAQWYQMGFPTEGKCEASFLTTVIEKPEDLSGVKEITASELRKKME